MSLVPAPDDTIETTTFDYMNGIGTPVTGAVITMRTLRRLIGTIPGLNSPKISTVYTYNRNFEANAPTVEEHRQACVMFWQSANSGNRLGGSSMPAYMAKCMADESYRSYSDLDLAEYIRQVWSILLGRKGMEADAKAAANVIQNFRRQGRHVVVMPHSQGNLMMNQALQSISDNPVAGVDSTCISVVSMASPVSQGWAVPDTNIAKIVVEFDQVPTLGFNQWPRTSTELSRQMEATARKWDLVGLGLAYRLKHGFTTLHFVDTSYLKYESLDRVVAGIKQAYAACTVAKMEIAPVKINVAQYFRPNVVFRNAFGNTLTRNVADDELFTGSPTIVSYDGQGTFRGVSQGTASIIATHGGRTGSGTVEVIAPLPVLMGSWSGTYRNLDVASSHGPFTVTVDGGKGLQSHAHMVWYNVGNGTSYVGDLYVRMQSDGTMAGNMIYNRAGQHIDFARWITLSVDGPGGPNTARGASWDYGTYANYWLIDLARVVN